MKYLSALQAVSGRDCIKNGSYPVFPDSDGKDVVKEAMVKAIEKVVAQTIELCRGSPGRRLFGGHSCEVAGSRYWVAQGLEIMRLQVFARWGSQVMLRYIADAPLESTVCFNRHQPTSSPTVFESKSQDAGENVLARKLRRFMPEAEAEFHELRELVKAGATSAQQSFVHDTVSSVWHRVARGGLDTPPAQWQTVYRWCFGLQSLCEVLSTVPTGAIECRRCSRDFRKGIRQGDMEATSDGNSTASQKREI